MSTNTLRSIRWLRTFAQILEVDERHVIPLKDTRPANAGAGRSVTPVRRRTAHD